MGGITKRKKKKQRSADARQAPVDEVEQIPPQRNTDRTTGVRRGKIDKLTLAPQDGSARCKVIFTAEGIMQALCDGKCCDFRLNDNHYSAIEGLLLDFLLESAFEGEHLDLELPLAETGILYDCVIGIGK